MYYYRNLLDVTILCLHRTLIPVLHHGSLAVDAILNYSGILDTLARVAHLSNLTEVQLQDARDLSILLDNNSSIQVLRSSNFSNILHNSAQEQSIHLVQVFLSIQTAAMQRDIAITTSIDIGTLASFLRSNNSDLDMAVNLLKSTIGTILTSVDSHINSSLQVSSQLSSDLPLFHNNSYQTFSGYNESQKVRVLLV